MKIIHVAGTNGKGSVCAFTTSMLVKAGKKTGTFISPHLVSMTERIRINGKQVSEAQFADAFLKVKKTVDEFEEKGGVHPSFFEILFLMAMVIFDEEAVEYVVLETGLGGRLDATNIFEQPLVSVITSVSMDHMEILGNTIEEIAAEKAGIIKKNIPVVYYGEDKKVRKILEKTADEQDSPKYIVKNSDILSMKKSKNNIAFSFKSGYDVYVDVVVPFIAPYQTINALMAVRTIEVLNLYYDAGISMKSIYEGLKDTVWEARMEQIMPGVFLDGAHNDDGVEAFIKAAKGYHVSGKKIVLFSAVKEKQYDKMIKRIAKESGATEFFVTSINNSRALKEETVSEIFEKYVPKTNIHVFHTVDEALKAALKIKGEGDALFIVGSLYLAGEVKKCILRM